MPYRVEVRPDKLRAYCDALDWNVDDLADASDVSRASIYRYLGHRAQPGPEFIAACAAIFGEEALSALFRFAHSDEDLPTPPRPRKSFAPRLAAGRAA